MARRIEGEDYVAPTPSGTPEQVAAAAKVESLQARATKMFNAGARGTNYKAVLTQLNQAQQNLNALNVKVATAEVAATDKTIAEVSAAIQEDVKGISAAEDTVIAAYENLRAVDPYDPFVPGNPPPVKVTTIDDPAYLALLSQFKAWGMFDIANDIARIRATYPDISSADLLTLLRTDPNFNQNYMIRFSGNKVLMEKGKPMLTEIDYLRTETAYEKIFRAYNLPQFQNRTYYGNLIGNEVDSTEVGTRVSLGYNRLLHADPETLQSWKKFYPMLSTGDIVGAMLDPKNQLPELERKVTAAEVGGAALAQGLNAFAAATTVQNKMYSNVVSGTLGAETFVAAGENLTQAKADYEKIAKELPRAEFLSSITPYMSQYGQMEAEQANILGLASAQRKKDELAAAEAARYLGKAGTYGSRSFGSKPSGLV